MIFGSYFVRSRSYLLEIRGNNVEPSLERVEVASKPAPTEPCGAEKLTPPRP